MRQEQQHKYLNIDKPSVDLSLLQAEKSWSMQALSKALPKGKAKKGGKRPSAQGETPRKQKKTGDASSSGAKPKHFRLKEKSTKHFLKSLGEYTLEVEAGEVVELQEYVDHPKDGEGALLRVSLKDGSSAGLIKAKKAVEVEEEEKVEEEESSSSSSSFSSGTDEDK
jgi:hypothetical protein